MTLRPDQKNEMEEAAKPLIKWMNDNVNPHSKIIVETNGVELLDGVLRVINNEFIKG